METATVEVAILEASSVPRKRSHYHDRLWGASGVLAPEEYATLCYACCPSGVLTITETVRKMVVSRHTHYKFRNMLLPRHMRSIDVCS